MRFPLLFSAALLVPSTLASFAAAPENDNFNSALELTGASVSTTGTNVGATREVGEPIHGESPGGRSVWWKWTAPGSGSVVIATAGSSFDTLLSAYTGSSIGTLDSVASNDDAGSATSSIVGFNVTAGTVYYIAVDGYLRSSGAANGSIQLSLTYSDQPLQRPANDDFANRQALSGTAAAATGSNFFASKEPDEPNHANELGGASVWWTWTAPRAGPVMVDTRGSNFDTLLGVYTGSAVTNLTLVARSDDVNPDDPTSVADFNAITGTAYQIAVDGYDGEPGDIQLHVTMKDLLLLQPPQPGPDGVRIAISGPGEKRCALEASADLRTWQRLAILSGTNALAPFLDSGATNAAHRFYRAQILP